MLFLALLRHLICTLGVYEQLDKYTDRATHSALAASEADAVHWTSNSGQEPLLLSTVEGVPADPHRKGRLASNHRLYRPRCPSTGRGVQSAIGYAMRSVHGMLSLSGTVGPSGPDARADGGRWQGAPGLPADAGPATFDTGA